MTFYNYVAGGTIEAVVNLNSEQVIDSWTDPLARPGASPTILPRALTIAAADGRVKTLLGDINAAELQQIVLDPVPKLGGQR